MKRHVRKLKKSRLLLDLTLVCSGIFFVCIGLFIFWAGSLKIPDLDSFSERRVSQSAKIYDRSGEVLLYNFGENTRRTIVSGDDISRNIKNAAVAIEDSEFYEHTGIKPTAILRAILANILSMEFSQGGSTITQQVVKNSLLTTDKKISRKLKEWVLSLKLERVYGKDQILEIYLNESPYGGTIYGVEEASGAFFGKKSADVSLTEAAYLAAIPQAPTYYSPYGNHKDELEKRKDLVLSKMLENKFITEEEYLAAREETVTFLPRGDAGIKAPHFVFYVREYLENKYGRKAIEDDGLRIKTTIDLSLQGEAERILKKYGEENKKKFTAENAALVAIDPKTGQILALVGSVDYFAPPSPPNCVPGATCKLDPFVNATTRLRQPGSAFKPFVYAAAFKKGYTPETTLFDLKTQFSTACEPNNFSKESPCFSPDNYDNLFRGPVSLRNALAQSLNIPSVKTLYLAGITDSINTARSMGITSLESSARYGLTLVLGGGEVTLLDMTSAYGVFANDGVRNPYVSVLSIENSKGDVLEKWEPRPTTVLEPNIARTISSILSDNVARTPTFGASSPLHFPSQDVAVKTGTTNDSRDAWIVGYTPTLAVGAWAGNNDNSPMVKQVAGLIVAPLWREFMNSAISSFPKENFTEPDSSLGGETRPILRGLWQGGITYTVDRFSGKLATEFTPLEAQEERAVKNIHSILYWIDKDNPSGALPSNPNKDPQFRYWEYPIRNWVVANNIIEETEDVIPKEKDTLHVGLGPTLSLSGLTPHSSVPKDSRITLSVSSHQALARVDYYINDTFVGSANKSPYSIVLVPNDSPEIVPGETNTLKIIGYDIVFNRSELLVPFVVSAL